MLLLDVANTFNCIDHEIVYIKMKNAGFGIKVIEWLWSYLTRFQRVKIDSKFSDVLPVEKGIAQGRSLDLFCLFFISMIFLHILSLLRCHCLLTIVLCIWVEITG